MTQPWRRTAAFAVLGSILTVAAGCTTVPPAPLSSRETAAAFRARSLDDEGLKDFALQSGTGITSWPPARWDTRALDVAALYFSPTLAVARAKWQGADAAVATAGELPNPTLSIAPQFVSNAGSMPAWVVASSLTQIIETAGKRKFRSAKARYLAEAARLDAVNAAWETIGSVAGAFQEVVAAQHRLTALDHQVMAQSALAEIAEKRFKAGTASSLELAFVRSARDKAVLDREATATALIDAHHQLAQAVGVPAEAIPLDRLVPEHSDGPATLDNVGTLRTEAVLNRADLLARLAEYGARESALQLEVARQFPDIEVGPGYEYDQGANKWGLSLGFPLPILNQNQGAIGEALAQRGQASDEFVALQAHVIGEIDSAADGYRAAERTRMVARELLHHQEAQSRGQQALFRRGEIDRLDLTAADVELANAELSEADAENGLTKAKLRLETAGQRSLDGFEPTRFLFQLRR